MTKAEIRALFSASHPKAIDFLETEYEADRDAYDNAAAETGYRRAGFRLGRVVFTTKNATINL